MTPAEAFARFAEAIHSIVPARHAIDLHTGSNRARGICGDHGRVRPTRQWLCPTCAGFLHDSEEILRIARFARRLAKSGIYDQKTVDATRKH